MEMRDGNVKEAERNNVVEPEKKPWEHWRGDAYEAGTSVHRRRYLSKE